jgi:hypothetical protein
MRTFAVALVLSAVALAGRPVRGAGRPPAEGVVDRHVGGNTVHGNDMFMVLDWNGKAITGTINPGQDNIVIKTATSESRRLGVPLRGRRQDKAGP